MTEKINQPMSEATIQDSTKPPIAERETEKRQREEVDEDEGIGADEAGSDTGEPVKATKRRELSPSALQAVDKEKEKDAPDKKSITADSEAKTTNEAATEKEIDAREEKPAVNDGSDKKDATTEAKPTKERKATESERPIESKKLALGFGSASGFASAGGFASATGFASAASSFSFGGDASKSSAGGFGSLLQSGTQSTFGSLLDKQDRQDESEGGDEENAVDEEQYVAVRGLERTKVSTGEEGEECIHSVKAKLYAINPESANEGWKERGVGTLRVLNAVESSDKKSGSRLVMRADAVLRVILNMPLRSSYKLEDGGEALGEKTIKMLGVEDGKGVWIAVRVGSKQAAEELKSVLHRCLDSQDKPASL